MDGGDEAAGKGRGTVKKGIDVDKARKRRENHVVKIRKEKLQEQYAKRRFVSHDVVYNHLCKRLLLIRCYYI